MKNRNFLRKCAAIAAFAMSAIVFLPEALLAGAVVGYVYGSGGTNSNNTVSDAQLDHLTHVMAVDLY